MRIRPRRQAKPDIAGRYLSPNLLDVHHSSDPMAHIAPKAIAMRGAGGRRPPCERGYGLIAVVTTSEDELPEGFAAEAMRQLQRLASSRPDDVHPHKVAVVATRTDGDRFTIVYRQRRSPQLLGRQGNAATFSALFRPRLGAEHLARIVLQELSEPQDPGRPGLPSWAEGLVTDPTAVRWLASLE